MKQIEKVSKIPLLGIAAIALAMVIAMACLSLTGCDNPVNSFTGTVVTVAAVGGVTAPAAGAAPAVAVTATDQYTGIVAWSPAVSGTFAAETVYTAKITLTAKSGFTLKGVPANFFTVEGATATNAANSGVITAVFAKTGAIQTPAAADYTFGNLNQTAGSVTPVTVTAKTGKSAGTVTVYYEGTDATTYDKNTSVPQTAGTYAVTFDVAAAAGWNAATGLSAGTLTINQYIEGNQTPVAADFNFGSLTQTFGSVTDITVTPQTGKSAGTVTVYYEGTDTTIYAKSASVPTQAGTYAVTFDVAAAEGWYPASGLSAGTLTVKPKVITFTIDAIAAQTHTGSAIEPPVTVKDGSATLVKDTDYTVTYGNNINTGTATVTVTGAGNYAGSSGIATFTINSAASYGISLSQSGTYDFTVAAPGYGAHEPLTVTVTNSGNQATGALTAALSGTHTNSFTLSTTSIAGIAAGGTGTFTVVPKTGLAAGTYTATVTVSGGNGISAAFNVSFQVTTAPVYGVTLSETGTHTFTSAAYGYSAPTALSVTVTNSGNQATGALTAALSGTHTNSFTLTGASIASIAVGGTGTFTVVPKTGLNAGTHTATVTVAGSNGISAALNVSFTVTPRVVTFTIDAIEAQTHTGDAIEPPVTVKDGAATLVKDTDYTVTYSNNTNAGTAVVTVAGINNYAGSTGSVNFAINPAAIYGISLSTTGTHTFTSATVGYGAQSPLSVTVTNTGNQATGNLDLAVSGTDFTLSTMSIADIAVGGTGSFTVVPKTGLAEGTHTANVTVSGGANIISQSFNVSFIVNVAPAFGISLSTTGTHTFTAATVGYGAQSPLSVTVTNSGDQPTGALTAALSGTHTNSFTLTGASIASIAAGGTGTFTVVPNTGLAAGTYTATVTVSGGNGISAAFNVSFTVNSPAATYSISLSQSGAYTFPAATVGYGAQTALTVTVTNTGNQATGNLSVGLSGAHPSGFSLSETSISGIPVGQNHTFTIAPASGLAANTYAAIVTVSGTNITAQTFNVSFIVNSPAPVYGISLSQSGTYHFTVAAPGYGAHEPLSVTVTNTGNQATGALTAALSGTHTNSFTLSTTSIASIAAGGTGTFTVVPNTGLAAGTYTATVTVSGGSAITAQSFDVSFQVTTAPVYGVTLSETGTHTFTSAAYGYSAPMALSVTVTNSGNQATGALTAALSGTHTNSFTLSTTSIASIAVGGTGNFTVVPKTGLAVGTHTATVTVSGSNSISAVLNVSFTVSKANSTVTTWPTAAAITYGAALSTSALSGGVNTPAGSFAWTNGSTVPSAGTSQQSVTFTPSDAANYNSVTGNVSITVNKANPTVTTWPTASAITYGAALSTSTLSGGSNTPAGSFAWTTPSTVPSAGTSQQSVTFTPTDTANYNTRTNNVSITVNKATPTVTTWPTATGITQGAALSASTLTGGVSTPTGSFAWTAPTTVPSAGTSQQSVTFTPSDTANYNSVTGNVSITVTAAATYGISLSQTAAHAFTAQTYGYSAAPAALSVTVTNTGNQATGDLTVELSGANPDSFTLNKETISSIAASGTTTATFTVQPVTGLAAGTHAATVTVFGGSDIAAKAFNVSFTVNADPNAPYVITGSGTTFTATRSGAVIGTADQPIQTVIEAVRTNANGVARTIQFGDGGTLNIGSAGISFNNTGGTWGLVTLTGSITSSVGTATTGTVAVADNVSVTSTANIANTNTGTNARAVYYDSTGTFTIQDGLVSTGNRAVHNNSTGTVTISGGTVQAISSNSRAVFNNAAGTVNISGGTVSGTYGVNNASAGIINISGGTVLGGFGVSNASTGIINITGGTVAVSDGASGTAITSANGNVTISGGEIRAVSPDSASTAINASNGTSKITVSGNARIISNNPSATGGTISIAGTTATTATRLEITGGTVENIYAGGNVIYNSSVTSVTISGGTVQAAGANGYAVYSTNASAMITLGGNPAITGIIRPSAAGQLTAASGFAPGSTRAYVLQYDSYATNNVAVAGAGSYLARFSLYNTIWTLAASGGNIVIGAAPAYGFTLSEVGTYTFASLDSGYSAAPTARTITINNTGAQASGQLSVALSGTNSTSFTLANTPVATINAGGTGTFTVRPNTGLASGTYTATVTVSGSGAGGTSATKTFDVSFTVIDANAPYIITGSGTSFTATRGGVNLEPAGQPIQTVIDTIRSNAAGKNPAIQFGDDTGLDIGSAGVTFSNTDAVSWGTITLTGEITSSLGSTTAGTITIKDSVSVTSTAYIENTNNTLVYNYTMSHALYNQSTGEVTISGGIIKANGAAVANYGSSLTISRGAAYAYGDRSPNAIQNNSTGTVTISSNAAVMNPGYSGYVVTNTSTGSILISGGTVTAAENTAVYNGSTGTVTISGGTVKATTGTTVNNGSTGTVTISGGTVSATTGTTVNNGSTGTVTISGGTVSATTGVAVKNNKAGKITVSQPAGATTKVTSANTNAWQGTIIVSDGNYINGSITVSGGTVENTAAGGNTLYNGSTGTVAVSGGTVSATTGKAVYNTTTGTVSVSGGTVKATTGIAIHSVSSGKVTVSQDAGATTLVTSANTTSTEGTIKLDAMSSHNNVRLEITGGTVSNTAGSTYYAVYNATGNNQYGSNQTSKTGGTVTGNKYGCSF